MLNRIDNHTQSEILDGNAVAGTSETSTGVVDHDGVELSIIGSDIDEFSDEENAEN